MAIAFKYRLYIAILLLSGFLGACNKDKITLQTQEIQTPTNDDLNTVFFVDALHGFAAGGTKYDRGILIKTNDGGLSWSSADSVGPKAIYTSYFFTAEKGFIGAFDSHVGYTSDSGKTFSNRVFMNYLPIRGLAFFDTQNGVFAAGTNYSDGSWAVTHDGGMHWAESPLQIHAFRCVDYADAQNICVGGYGTLLHSGDGGDHFAIVKKEGDFYTGLQFMNDSRGVAVGYQGEILLTTDKGLTWKKVKSINHPFEAQDHFLGVSFFDAQHGYVVGESGLMMRTSDGGENWKRVKTFTDKSLRSVQLLTATSGVIVAEGGKVFLFRE